MSAINDESDKNGDMLLMCKDVPVYNTTNWEVLNESLLPGAMLRRTLGCLTMP